MDHSHHNHHLGAQAEDSKAMDMDHDMHGMNMAYHFGASETILFGFWKTHGAGGIIGSCFILVLICFLYEGIKWARICFKKKAYETAVALGEHNAQPIRRKITPHMVLDTVLHALQLTLGYSLMLVFMTFNIWLCAAVVFGEAIAHLVFRFMYPDLERFRGFGADETCCG